MHRSKPDTFDFRIETSALIPERGWDEVAEDHESRKFHRVD